MINISAPNFSSRKVLFAKTAADFGINNITCCRLHQCSVITLCYLSFPWTLLRNAASPFAFASKTSDRELGHSSTRSLAPGRLSHVLEADLPSSGPAIGSRAGIEFCQSTGGRVFPCVCHLVRRR